MKEFSDDIKKLLKERFPDRDIYNMSLEELQEFKKEVIDLRHEYALLENAYKVCANAGYGSSANEHFYFFLPKLAADITGECRNLTQTMWNDLENFFHETLWERNDLQEKFGFELDESKHDWYRQQPVSIYSDTDSCVSSTIINTKNANISIEELFNKSLQENNIQDITKNGQEIVRCNDNVLNWTNDKGLYYAPIKYIMRHKVSKPMYKITSKSEKKIIVTEDHSCVVFRNGEQLVVKAKDINKETDKILSNFKIMKYQFEKIESIEQIEYNDDYVYDIEVDDNSHTFIGNDILVHNSVYTTYGSLFDAMTEESQKKFDTDEKKIQFILKFNKEFLDKQNTDWCENIFNPRNGKSIHEFELETISRSQINIKKKNYLKAYAFSKGKFFNPYKLSATGIELVKSSTPGFCRDKLPEVLNDLMFKLNSNNKEEFVMEFIDKMQNLRREFYMSDIEYISQSVNIGNYKKFVIDDRDSLIFEKGCPTSVHAIARYNFLAHKNGHDNLITRSGKIKYYNILIGGKQHGFFGYPSGMLPEWAPKMDKITQWEKTVIGPINRFLEVMDIPLLSAGEAQQMTLFV